MEIVPAVQTYEWGKKGKESIVGQLIAARGVCINQTTTYAELWLGTHPNGPATVKSSGEELKCYIENDPSVLGDKSRCQFGDELPFILKVLSVGQALSVQAHPTKKHAEKLFKCRPDLYPDPNHKPELVIALTPFKGLCGFRPIEEIKHFVCEIKEFKELIGADKAECLLASSECDAEKRLKDVFSAVMRAPESKVSCYLKGMLNRLKDKCECSCDEDTKVIKLIKALNCLYPDDVGCFSPFFLNVIDLEPGQAIFLGPNEPHAYLSGDCVECMACSDNVVRAGLTTKFKDVDTLVEMLNYAGQPAKCKLFKSTFESCNSELFTPPVRDFAVAKIKISCQKECCLACRPNASIFIMISGKAKMGCFDLGKGSAVFLAANEACTLKDITEEVLIYQAMCGGQQDS